MDDARLGVTVGRLAGGSGPNVVRSDRTFPVLDACVIGAGPSGLATCGALRRAGQSFACYERSGDVGGVWNLDAGTSPAYPRLRANTSKRAMAFADFAFDAAAEEFPPQADVLQYLRSYADHLGVRPQIEFNCTVTSVRREADGLWHVELSRDGAEPEPVPARFRGVVVSSGQFGSPRLPTAPDPSAFTGEWFHAADYVSAETPVDCRGKRVVVVGLGTSAVEIAVDLAENGAAEVLIAARSGRYLAMRVIDGRPLDAQSPHPSARLPLPLRLVPRWGGKVTRQFIRRFYRNLGARYLRAEDVGFPAPDYNPWNRPASIGPDLRRQLASGVIQPKGAISDIHGDRLTFADHSVVQADVVIYSTGYRWRVPFIAGALAPTGVDEPLVEALPVYRRVAHPSLRGLYFVGFANQICSIIPLAEQQALWVASHLASDGRWPTEKVLASQSAPLGEPLGNICNFYVEELRADRRRMKPALRDRVIGK